MLFPAALRGSSRAAHGRHSDTREISLGSASPDTTAPLEFKAMREPITNEPATVIVLTSTSRPRSREFTNSSETSEATNATLSLTAANTPMLGLPA